MATFIIPAAGRATRLRPITANVSKTMVTVGGKPTIAHILDKIGPEHEVIIVDGALQDVREFVKPRYKYVRFIQQDVLRGELDAASLGLGIMKGDGPVIIWNGDTIVEDEFELDVDGPLVKKVDDHSSWLMFSAGGFINKPKQQLGDNFYACVGVFRFTKAENLRNACAESFKEGCYGIEGAFRHYKLPSYNYTLTKVEHWYDVGNLENYHRTRAELLTRTCREFNELHVDTYYNTITKVGKSPEAASKIDTEANWYASLKGKQQLFAPRLVDSKHGSMTISLEPGITVSELLLYHDLPESSWSTILQKIFKVMHDVFYEPILPWPDSLEHMWIEKNVERVKEYAPEFVPWVEQTGKELVANAKYSKIIHGDLATHNILYDPFTGKLTLIDPRGSFMRAVPEGDQQYDICKLWEDLYWGLTFKLAGSPSTNVTPFAALERLTSWHQYRVDLMRRGGLLLLLTAVPFHNDNPRAQELILQTARRTIIGTEEKV